jgi:hypothetical protein
LASSILARSVSLFGAIVDAVVLAVVAAGLLGLGAWRFSKIEI